LILFFCGRKDNGIGGNSKKGKRVAHHFEFYLLFLMNSIKASPPKLQNSKKTAKNFSDLWCFGDLVAEIF